MILKYIAIELCTNSSNNTVFYLFVTISFLLTAFISSEFGIFVYRDFTSRDTRYELSGTVSTAFSLLISYLHLHFPSEAV